MKSVLTNKNFYLMLVIDAALVAASYVVAYLLRFDGTIPPAEWHNIKNTLHFVIPLKIMMFWFFGLYKGMWRYTSLVDLQNVLKATTVASTLIVVVILYLHRFQGYPRSVYIIDWALTFLIIGGIRVAIRLTFANHWASFWAFRRRRVSAVKRLLIMGAGDAGEKVLREIQENPEMNFEPAGFLDDDSYKWGKAIHGVPVMGAIDEVNQYVNDFDEILIAIPSAKGEMMRRIVAVCETTGKRFRTVPGIFELIEGKVSVKTIREVTMQDLLGREEVNLDKEGIRQYLKGKRILVTGAGGSIGSELVRQLCRFEPEKLGLLDFSEFNLFRLEMECQQRFAGTSICPFLVDIKNRKAIHRIFGDFSPHVVFHAAAYKHVPLQEVNPWEAITNNIIGTRNILDAAAENGVERFVLVSTDKAVRPTNVMGATKRVTEMLIESMSENATTNYMAVRFGNVVGSSGSAIPLFQEQISRGGPVTVTDPEMTRYFMTIPEAAQLILQTGAMGEGGEIFILDMGKPVRILDMARDLIRLNGFEPERDIEIQFIGLRPGEKLYEELITEGEGIVPTGHKKILVLRGNTVERPTLDAGIAELVKGAEARDDMSIRKTLKALVPEYTPRQQVE